MATPNWGPGSPKPVPFGGYQKGKVPRKTRRAERRYKKKYGKRHPGFGTGYGPNRERKVPSPDRLRAQEKRQAERARARKKGQKSGIGKRPGGGGGGGGSSSESSSSLTDLLTEEGLRRELAASTRLEFGPTERAIQADLRASQARHGDITGWFQDYQNKLAGGKADTSEAYANAAGQFNQQLKEAGVQDKGARQELKETAEADAELRGVPVDRKGAEDSVNASAARQNLQSSFGGMIASQGANQRAYFNDKERIGAGEAASQHMKELARERGIRADLRELARSKGDFAVSERARLRESDRDYKSRLSAEALDRESLSIDAMNSQLDRQLDRKEAGERARHNRVGESETRRHNLNTESTARGNLAASMRRIQDDLRHDRISEAQAQARIAQAKKKFRFDQNKEKQDKIQTRRDDRRMKRADRKGKGKGGKL
jgi:hypothetical protein